LKQEKLSIKKRIEILIRARYPITYVISSEEKRVEDTLKSIGAERGEKVLHLVYHKGPRM
jgi:hypothetical protein